MPLFFDEKPFPQDLGLAIVDLPVSPVSLLGKIEHHGPDRGKIFYIGTGEFLTLVPIRGIQGLSPRLRWAVGGIWMDRELFGEESPIVF